MTTIRDIAARARVSVSTVSLALNGDARVRSDTRERIVRIAEALNYRPMRAARSLSSGRSWTIDVFNPVLDVALSSSFTARFLHGLHDRARADRYAVVLRILDDEREAREALEQLILERATDGVVLMNPSDDEALVERLTEHAFPHVLLGRGATRSSHSVDNDNVAVAADATDHLVSRELAPVLLLQGPERQTFAQDRLRGYREALARHGLADGALTCVTDGTAEDARDRVRALLDPADAAPFRSVLALSDALALGALRGARDSGRRVPDDVAIMGMNNDDITDFTDPPLSSVELGAYELGRRAADTLVALLAGRRDVPLRTIVPHALVPKASTGTAP